MSSFSKNNFDLIRLFAALQVFLHHAYSHLDLSSHDSILMTVTSYFPGVPIFFFISGYLISRSYERSSSISYYTRNRMLRIYPALYVCTGLTILSVWATGYFSSVEFDIPVFLIWLVGQLSFYQFYTPDFMREFSTGVLNGSLWTITVELQFYLLTPILFYLIRRMQSVSTNSVLIFLIIIFTVMSHLYSHYDQNHGDSVFVKIWGVSFLPWFYMFLVGVLFQQNFDFFLKNLRGKLPYLFVLYVVAFHFTKGHMAIEPIVYWILACIVFVVAYSNTSLSEKVLHRNDFSYGIYIYHMPVINISIFYGIVGSYFSLFVVIISTLVFAAISWFFVEKVFLARKKNAARM